MSFLNISKCISLKTGINFGRSQVMSEIEPQKIEHKDIKTLTNHTAPIKLWVTDIDGTLRTIGEDAFIPEAATKACSDMKEKAGIDIALATGKSFDKVKELNIHNDSKAQYIITEHGARIQKMMPDKSFRPISKPIYLDQDDFKLIIKKYQEYVQEKEASGEKVHEHLLCYYYDEKQNKDFIFTTTEPSKLSSYDRDFATKIDSYDDIKDMKMTKVLFYKDNSTDYKDMEEIRDIFAPYLEGSNSNIFVSSKLFCEILNKNASKGNAINVIIEDMNKTRPSGKQISLKNVVSIGDADNDIPSIETVQNGGGVGIAMGNGTDNVKAKSQYYTSHILQNGYSNAAQTIMSNNQRLAAQDLANVLRQIDLNA